MKKLLACLLALMLPCCALADTFAMTVTSQVSQDGLAELCRLDAAAQGLDRSRLSEKSVAALATLLSGFSAVIQADDTGALDASLSYEGQQIFSLQSAAIGDTDVVVTSLCPGLMLTSPVDTALNEAWEQAGAALEDMNWLDLFETLDECLSGWEQTLDITTEYGYFAGDTYALEGECITMRFDERDISVLLEALSHADWPDGISELTRAVSLSIWGDETSLRDAVLERVHITAFQNQYSYVMRLVDSDRFADPIGFSLLTYEGGQLVSTLSMGVWNGRIDTVLGYGLRGENVYLSSTLALDVPDGEPFFSAQLWSDPDQEGYYAVSSDPRQANLQMTAEARYTATAASGSVTFKCWGPALWDAVIETTVLASDENELITTVTLNGKPLLEVSLYGLIMPDNLPALETDGLQELPVSDDSPEAEQLLDEAVMEGIGALLTTMRPLVPQDLMTTLIRELLLQ